MTKIPGAKSEGEEMLALHIRIEKLPKPEREYRFHPTRMWRFDFAFPGHRVAVEVEGGIFNGGAHTRGRHYLSDMEKYNEAALLDWTVLRFSTDQVRDGTAISTLKRAFA